jgi:AI-2 transport protein TqsA
MAGSDKDLADGILVKSGETEPRGDQVLGGGDDGASARVPPPSAPRVHRHASLTVETSEGIKVFCLMVIASGVIYSAMDRLESILIPFVIALAGSYLLTPIISLLRCGGCIPRGLAVLMSLVLAAWLLLVLGTIMIQALGSFRARAPLYRERMESLLEASFKALESLRTAIEPQHNHSTDIGLDPSGTRLDDVQQMATDFMRQVSITNLILSLLGSAAHILEDVMYVLLFLIFMLIHDSAADDNDPVGKRVERQVFIYIRGKCSISAYVGACHALVLWAISLDMWLPFGVMTFFLNFIPNVGGMGAVLLPMPLVALDPAFSSAQITVGFALPFLNNLFAKDVLEPTLLGQSTSLHPVAVLMAILLFGSVWGITGMVMAIPLTAVLRSKPIPNGEHAPGFSPTHAPNPPMLSSQPTPNRAPRPQSTSRLSTTR